MDKKDFQKDLTKYFSDHILLYASLATFAGAWLIFDQELIGGISLVLIGLLFLTARYGLQINFQKKTYRKFTQIIGIKTGEHIPFDTVDYLFIISGKRSQTMNYKSLSTTISETEFNGYIKFDNKTRLHLLSFTNKGRLIKRLKLIANDLNCGLIDYSNGEPMEL